MTMSLQESAVLDEVRAQTAKELGIDLGNIAEDTVLKELPGADSVRLLRVVAQIERVYDVEFEDEDIFDVRTPRQLAGLVLAQAGAEV
ncbi:acyl carrier protein [Streptomyces pseudovenezuelae]|uniref:Acyl carrier protein n=1 Tax=Streptomyces pseudovenezuelae TaxID=67350 RepID=A0ABT6M315_9ACTN|nr:acyl carrier protein [Streptomyces pseudovenezuelae]MDH6222927.1 acyl carrier protein [Streptomyces pseudovenezuelae]